MCVFTVSKNINLIKYVQRNVLSLSRYLPAGLGLLNSQNSVRVAYNNLAMTDKTIRTRVLLDVIFLLRVWPGLVYLEALPGAVMVSVQ